MKGTLKRGKGCGCPRLAAPMFGDAVGGWGVTLSPAARREINATRGCGSPLRARVNHPNLAPARMKQGRLLHSISHNRGPFLRLHQTTKPQKGNLDGYVLMFGSHKVRGRRIFTDGRNRFEAFAFSSQGKKIGFSDLLIVPGILFPLSSHQIAGMDLHARCISRCIAIQPQVRTRIIALWFVSRFMLHGITPRNITDINARLVYFHMLSQQHRTIPTTH